MTPVPDPALVTVPAEDVIFVMACSTLDMGNPTMVRLRAALVARSDQTVNQSGRPAEQGDRSAWSAPPVDEPLRPGDNPLADQLIEENARLRRERNDWMAEANLLTAEREAQAPVDEESRWLQHGHSDPYCVNHCSVGHKHSQCGCPCDHSTDDPLAVDEEQRIEALASVLGDAYVQWESEYLYPERHFGSAAKALAAAALTWTKENP